MLDRTRDLHCLIQDFPGFGKFVQLAVGETQTERGQGIGRKLLDYAVEYARAHAVRRLYLETNKSLTNAIHLYESVGFRHLTAEQVQPSPYARANVYMEMIL